MTGAGRLGLGAALLMTLAACAGGEDGPDFSKLTTVVVGQSSRADVLGAMGRPSQVLRTAKGEAWVYEAGGGRDRARMAAAGTQAATTVASALIPFAGLVGAGLGLANSMTSDPRGPQVTTVTVDFAETGVVRDCLYATNVITNADLARADGRAPFDCSRPVPPRVD